MALNYASRQKNSAGLDGLVCTTLENVYCVQFNPRQQLHLSAAERRGLGTENIN